MEPSYDVVKSVLDLAATVQEGLEHIHRRQSGGHSAESTISLFTDVVEAFAKIEKAVQPLLPSVEGGEELIAKTDALRKAVSWMMQAYEGSSDVTPLATLQFTLLPRFRAWHDALQAVLGPRVAS